MLGKLPFHGVLIDMDGLLLDTERLSEVCWRAAEVATGHDMPEGFYFTLIGQSISTIKVRLIEVMHPECDIDAFLAVANREYKQALSEKDIPVKRGARELLEYLRDTRIPFCLATSTNRLLAEQKLQRTGLLDLLPLRVCGDEVEHSKPAPDIYRKAAGVLGFPASRLLALEDSGNGIRSAKSAGCCAVHIPDIAPVPAEVQALTDAVFKNLEELLAAMRRGEILFTGHS